MSQMIGVILAILLGMMSLPQLMSLSREANNNMVMSNVAQQATQFNDAVTRYVTTYTTEIEAVATATEPAVIPVTTLKNVGLLPASFHATTPWGGTFAAQVLQPSAGNLEVLATTSGGESLPDNKAVKIANLIGQAGGFIPLNDTGRYSAGNAYGTGWGPLSTTNYTVTGGQLASLITFNQGQLTDNRLYRNAVPGQPQLNQMSTPLNMRAQATENTSDTLCIVGDTSTYGRIAVDSNGAVLSCQLGIWKQQGSGYWKDPVATFANLPTIDNNVGDVRMVTGLSRGFTWNGSSWVAIAVDQNGNLTIPGTATINALNGNLQITSIATEGAACSGEGRIAASSAVSGLILSCQSGIWRKASMTNWKLSEGASCGSYSSGYTTTGGYCSCGNSTVQISTCIGGQWVSYAVACANYGC